jgi:hypothetical protein
MPILADVPLDNRFMALFVGAKHSGKSCAAASFEKGLSDDKFIHFLDFDGRIGGVKTAPGVNLKKISYKYYPPRVGKNQTPFYQQINQDMEAVLAQTASGQCPYGGLVGDSLTAECFALICDAIPLTHTKKTDSGQTRNVGKSIGIMNMAGPEDYGFEATGTYNLMAFLRSLPMKYIILTAHLVDKFGKADPENPFSESIVVGEKLSLRDKIGTNIGIYFDHIFRFERRMVGSQERFFVRFRSNIACTSYSQLPNEEVDITGKNFYEVLQSYLKG